MRNERMMMKKYRAFWVEAVIIVVSIAVFGALAARIYILSAQVNRKAADIDRAVEISSGIIEQFIRLADVDSFLSDSDLFPNAPVYNSDDFVIIYTYFDREWMSVPAEAAWFVLEVSLYPEGEGHVYTINVSVSRNGTEQTVLTALETKVVIGM